jgi:hypothetical protein
MTTDLLKNLINIRDTKVVLYIKMRTKILIESKICII